jgi:hypothetical protein
MTLHRHHRVHQNHQLVVGSKVGKPTLVATPVINSKTVNGQQYTNLQACYDDAVKNTPTGTSEYRKYACCNKFSGDVADGWCDSNT